MSAGTSRKPWRGLIGALLGSAAAAAPAAPPSIAAVIPPTGPPPTPPGDVVRIAWGRYEPDVRRHLERLVDRVEAAPRAADAWTQLAVALHAYGEHATARRCYEQALELDPGDARRWYLLADVLSRTGAHDAALEALDRSIALEPARAASHRRLAEWRLRGGDLVGARRAADAALALDPDDRAAHVVLVRIDLQERDDRAALDRATRLLARDPDDPYLHYLAGTACRGLGRAGDARSHLELASARGDGPSSPGPGDAWLDEVATARVGARERLMQAVRALRRAEPGAAVGLLEPLRGTEAQGIDITINLARAYRMQGRVDAAIELLEEARRRRDHHLVRFQLAAAHRQSAVDPSTPPADRPRLLTTALGHARTALELAPAYAPAHALSAEILEQTGNATAALEAFERACRHDPAQPRWSVQLGAALCRAERWADAIEPLERARRLGSSDPATVHLLAAALANAGRLADARSILEDALGATPRDARLRRSLERVRAAERSSALEAVAP